MLNVGGLPAGSSKITREQIIAALGFEPVGGQGLNLARGTSSEWSEWITPAPGFSSQSIPGSVAYLPSNKKGGDKFTSSVEIEFENVTISDGGTFCFCSQGSIDESWEVAHVNPWYGVVNLTEPPKNGTQRFLRTIAINGVAVGNTRFRLGFRADYWGGGRYRYRCVKVECGEVVDPHWTPAPEDILASIDDLAARVKALENKQ